MCYILLRDRDMDIKQPKQKTPKGHEIPIPTKEEFERNLKKVDKTDKSSSRSLRSSVSNWESPSSLLLYLQGYSFR